MGVTYDTGVLISAERGERATWSRHRGLLVLGAIPVVPAPVLAQAWRGGSRQALLARLLAGCEVEAMTQAHARAIGELLGVAGHADVVDAAVVESAIRHANTILTADRADIDPLVSGSGRHVVVDEV